MQTDCRPQKRGRGLVGPCSDPLVGPRDPACRDALGAAPHSSCSCDRLVGLATSPSGRRTRSPHQKQTETVMLAHCFMEARYEVSSTVFFHIKSAENKLSLVDKLCRLRLTQHVWQGEWRALRKEIDAYIDVRNDMA